MASSGALASTRHPPNGRLGESQGGNHQDAHGQENVMTCPRVDRPALAAETETGSGTESETISGGTAAVKGGEDDPGVGLDQGLGLGPDLGQDLDQEQGLTGEGLAPNGQHLESSLPRGRSVEEAGSLGMRVEDIKEGLAALKMVCL